MREGGREREGGERGRGGGEKEVSLNHYIPAMHTSVSSVQFSSSCHSVKTSVDTDWY